MGNIILEFTELYQAIEGMKTDGNSSCGSCDFAGENFRVVDLRDIEGTDKYIDPESEIEIKTRLGLSAPFGIHLLDNGNYHYATRFFLEQVKEEFALVVFDKHSDDQLPAFAGMRSCGSWVRDAKEDLGRKLQKITLIQGTDRIRELDIRTPGAEGDSRDRIGVETEESEKDSSGLPVYISIDLDILSEDVIKTNWDQGDLELTELQEMVRELLKKKRVIGIDICGGPVVRAYDVIHEDQDRAIHVYAELIERFRMEINRKV